MGNPLHPRQLQLLSGEASLRAHLPDDVAINSTCIYDVSNECWLVRVKVWPDENSPRVIELGMDRLEEFPSELMIAQAMLVT